MSIGNEYSNIIHRAEYYIEEYIDTKPALSNEINDLLRIIRIQNNNEKLLIKLVLKHQKINKQLNKVLRRIYHTMNNGQKNIIDVWLEGSDVK